MYLNSVNKFGSNEFIFSSTEQLIVQKYFVYRELKSFVSNHVNFDFLKGELRYDRKITSMAESTLNLKKITVFGRQNGLP